MKEFVRRDTCQVFVRIGANRSRVRVLHATAAGSFSNVEDESVAFERSSAHELQFVLADASQLFLDYLLPPVVAVNHHSYRGRYVRQLKYVNLPNFNRAVRQRIIARRFKSI